MKASYALSLLFWLRCCSGWRSGATSASGSISTNNSGPRGRSWQRHTGKSENGFLLLFLCPLLLLAFLFLAGSIKLMEQTQERVATQSRLDACAVEIAVGRKQLFGRLAKTNRWISLTGKGIAVARGLMVLAGPAGALAGRLGEQGLLVANRAAFLEQELEIHAMAARELGRINCKADRFSKVRALCQASPFLEGAFRREQPLMPDVKGVVHLKSMEPEVTKVRCYSLQWPPLKTVLLVKGDPALEQKEFTDAYHE